ncbi:MAG: D-alanine--D-alanine ligase [Rhodothermaceae bacterium]|nr:D-alanine--D-alanine ligase [Rhodothermaceae bacterium]
MSFRIGLVYDRFGEREPPPGAPPDWDAEYEPERTILALEAAVQHLGHTPVRLGNAAALLARMQEGDLNLDGAINIAEGYGSRNREAHVPVLLELAGVPCIGSDALALSVSLDKHLTKLVAEATGLATPTWTVVRGAADLTGDELMPVFVKPRYEGTAKGIAPTSRCDTREELRAEVARQVALYRQDVLIEAFVEGAEFTVGVIGHNPPEALPVLQRATERTTGIGLHALERHEDPDAPFDYHPGIPIDPALEFGLQRAALAAHDALGCHDFSRSDFRVSPDGRVWFLEINPLPTFAPDGTFAILAELAGQSYEIFLADVLARGLDRLKRRK